MLRRMGRAITTVNLDEALLEEVRESGVRNISKYIEGLMKKELRGVEQTGKRENARVQKMVEKLDEVENRWFDFLKREGANT